MGDVFYYLSLRKISLSTTAKVETQKEKIYRFGYIKVKSLSPRKHQKHY